jgi:hypothetical protein
MGYSITNWYVQFFGFGIIHQEKSGNPALQSSFLIPYLYDPTLIVLGIDPKYLSYSDIKFHIVICTTYIYVGMYAHGTRMSECTTNSAMYQT